MDPIFVVALLALNVAAAEWLARHTRLRGLGSALLVILTTALCANLGLMPTVSEGSVVYDVVFGAVTPLGIFWLLLAVDLRQVAAAGPAMLALFAAGAAGTFIGVFAGILAVGGTDAFGGLTHALGGMFVATYTGGSANYNAVAYHFDFGGREPTLFAGAAAVDSAATALWMALSIGLPRWLARFWGQPKRRLARGDAARDGDAGFGRESADVFDFAVLLALGALGLGLSRVAETWTGVPDILVLTLLALVLAQTDVVQRLPGARTLGLLAILFFLAVIGALCDASALAALGPSGFKLCGFVAIALCVHGVFVFGTARALGLDPEEAAVASQANVGGGTTALALAKSLHREDLVLPGILIGSIGTALGTFLGLWAARLLG